jgi:acyl-CoA oxidase
MLRAVLAFARAPRLQQPTIRTLATATDAAWEKQWQAQVDTVTGDVGSYEESAAQLREMSKSGVLRFTDLRDNPERFFSAHRILAEQSPLLGPGFWIRFTVHYNLFAGTVLAVGGEEHLQMLEEIQESGELGCFALTEQLAGVNSGLVVDTRITWDNDNQNFVLESVGGGANKNWISQGLVGDKAVVLADLNVNNQSYGPHAFIMNLRENGKVVDNVSLEDMGRKTVGNDLDNARIHFNSVRLPKSAMLNRYADIDDNGDYVQKIKGMRTMEMIGQRLFSGRIAVAQAALEFRRKLFKMTKEYSDNKKCWSPSGNPVLSDIPQLKSLYEEAKERGDELDRFVAICEEKLAMCLQEDILPPLELTEAIAVAKIRAVDESIEMCFRLKQEVGSYALMSGTGFEQMDFLQCAKFAEGDSRILMLKMSRDRLNLFKKNGPSGDDEEDELCHTILEAVASRMKENGGDRQAAFDGEWESFYDLARLVMGRISRNYLNEQ